MQKQLWILKLVISQKVSNFIYTDRNFHKATMFIGKIVYLFHTIDKFLYQTILGELKNSIYLDRVR